MDDGRWTMRLWSIVYRLWSMVQKLAQYCHRTVLESDITGNQAASHGGIFGAFDDHTPIGEDGQLGGRVADRRAGGQPDEVRISQHLAHGGALQPLGHGGQIERAVAAQPQLDGGPPAQLRVL